MPPTFFNLHMTVTFELILIQAGWVGDAKPRKSDISIANSCIYLASDCTFARKAEGKVTSGLPTHVYIYRPIALSPGRQREK